ncbi:MAG: DUF6119 family protein [Kineosporiaceae bacterium]
MTGTAVTTRGTRRKQTRLCTLYRLGEWADLQESTSYLTEAAQDLSENPLELTLAQDVLGVLFHGERAPEPTDWSFDLSLTCGVEIRHDRVRAGAVLFLSVDGVVYALTYGSGHTWLDGSVKDERFGLSVVIRCLDSEEIVDIVRSSLGGKGRTDSTLVPDGIPVTMLRLDKQAELIRRLAGKSADLPTTFSDSGGSVTVHGSAGLRMRFGIEARDLIADIRAVAAVLATPVRPELAFVEHVVPVCSPDLVSELDAELETLLAWPAPVADALSLAVPESCLTDWGRKESVGLKVGSVASPTLPELSLDQIVRRAGLQPAGRRVAALRDGRVELFEDRRGQHSLGRSAASRWLQAHVSLGARRFVRSEDQWFELGADYLSKLRADVTAVLARGGTVTLPDWRRHADGTYEAEKDYNHRVAFGDRRFVHMDCRLVQLMPGRSSGIEICDLLGPDNELIHIKRAKGSAELSHLFTQAAVSEQVLRLHGEARKRFAALAGKDQRRSLPEDFVPGKIVYGILLKEGEELTADTLFPFTQVALLEAIEHLRGRATVEVVGIRVAPPAGPTTGPGAAARAPRPRRGKVPIPGTPS